MKGKKVYKVIFLMSHPPAYENYPGSPRFPVSWETADGNWVGLMGPGDWGDIIGSNVLERSEEFEFEVWQPDLRADKVYSHRYPWGLVHKLIPAVHVKTRRGMKSYTAVDSPSVFKNLKELNGEEKTILHFPADYSHLNARYLKEFSGIYPVVNVFFLNPRTITMESNTLNPLKLFHRWAFHLQKKRHFSRIKEVIINNEEDIDLVRKFIPGNIHIGKFAGLNFNEWTIDKTKAEARNALGIAEDRFIMLSSSRLIPTKQIDKLIGIAGRLPAKDFKLYITGAGENHYTSLLKEMISKSGMEEQIELVGYLEKKKLRDYYLAADLFVSTSLLEAGPGSGIIALALETPIFATDTGMLSAYLRTRGIGILVPPEDYGLWEKELAALLTGKKSVKSSMREEVGQEFSQDRYFNDLIDIYKQTAQNFYKS